jgi:hypothetical protein
MLRAWLRNLVDWKARFRFPSKADHRKRSFKPQLERFEDRMVPATHIWTGAAGSSWLNPGDWLGGSPFGDPSPHVVFPAMAVQRVVHLDTPAPQPIASLEFDAGSYLVFGAQSLVFRGPTSVTMASAGTDIVAVTIDQEPTFVAPPTHVYNVAAGGVLDIEAKITGASPFNMFDKIGPGMLKLSKPCNYAGPTQVMTGTLEVDSLLAASPVTVQVGAVLKGLGHVQTVNVAGTLSPGANLPGTLTATAVSFAPGSAFRVRLAGTASFDRLVATGPVSLGGATKLQVSLGFVPLVGDSFTILQGAVFGNFLGLPNNQVFFINGRKFQIHYTPTSVVLTCLA